MLFNKFVWEWRVLRYVNDSPTPITDNSKPAEGKTENGDKQKACASTCGVNQANIGQHEASAPGATSVSANHIIQYPRQPKMDDGKWMGIGSLIGSILSTFADNGTVKKAANAESEWKNINEALKNKGNEMWGQAPAERDLADGADTALQNQYGWNIGQRDAELARAQQLDNCNDALHEKVCQFAECGYKPDYDGIKARIMSDVAAQTKKSRLELKKNLNRYSANQCCGIETALATTAISTTVGALYKAREDERARAWQINEGLIFKAAELMERDRNARFANAAARDQIGVGIQQTRYQMHNANYQYLTTLGADFLSSAGKNYAWLAESYRRTADKMAKNFASAGAVVGAILAMFLNKNSGENKCGG